MPLVPLQLGCFIPGSTSRPGARLQKIEQAYTAVYLLEDIWQLINTSGQDTALGIVEFVNRRLSHKSPIVKQKVALQTAHRSSLTVMIPQLSSQM